MADAEVTTIQGPTNPVSAPIDTRVVEALFAQQSSIVVGALAGACLGLVCYARSGQTWLLPWSITFILIALARLKLARAFHARDQHDDHEIWTDGFAIGASADALAFGLASAATVLWADPLVQMVMMTGQAAYVTASAVRTCMLPRAARLQVCVPLGLVILACLLKGERFYLVYAALVGLQLVGTLELIRVVGRQTSALLTANERASTAIDDLAKANDRLEALATTDLLTGLTNRRGFDAALSKQCALAVRESQDMSLLLLDVDHLQALNEAFGQPAGDACLRRIAARLRDIVMRPADLVARSGGGQFGVILPNTGHFGAGVVAERVRVAIHALDIEHPTTGATTISVGYATLEPYAFVDAAVVVALAADAMRRAAAAGGNRIDGAPLLGQPGKVPLTIVAA